MMTALSVRVNGGADNVTGHSQIYQNRADGWGLLCILDAESSLCGFFHDKLVVHNKTKNCLMHRHTQSNCGCYFIHYLCRNKFSVQQANNQKLQNVWFNILEDKKRQPVFTFEKLKQIMYWHISSYQNSWPLIVCWLINQLITSKALKYYIWHFNLL